jgi:hypothetical protein
MGYDIYGYHRKTDNDYRMTIQCQYAYQPVFKDCFGKDIKEFNGRVTKAKLSEFETGVMKFINTPERFNLDNQMYQGNLANNKYSSLCRELLELVDVMKIKEVRYLNIG